jgi:thiol-disulfide isomerase/thioredoxin
MKSMKRAILALACGAALSIGCQRTVDLKPSGVKSFDAKVAQARKENKPLLVMVSAPWCGACVAMQSEFDHPAMRRMMERTVPYVINYDAPVTQDIRARLYSRGPIPATLLIGPQGKVLGQWVGWAGVDQHVTQVRAAMQ